MRRFLYAAPAALLSAACATRPWTPSVSVAYWAQDVPDSVDTSIASNADLLPLWQLPPGNRWARYNKFTLFAALSGNAGVLDLPNIDELDVLEDARAAADAVARAGLPSNTMWMLDLRGAASVAFGTALSQAARDPVSLVITFNNWPTPYEVVPAEETLAALVRMHPKLPDPAVANTHPVFLLDAWRLAFRYDAPPDGAFDNRYMINPGDLPAPDVLQQNGITHLVYVVEDLDDTSTEEDDLYSVFAGYQAAGIALHMVDLRVLAKSKPGVHWASVLASHSLSVKKRTTLLDDPSFYARARGGFGAFGGPRIYSGGGWRRSGPGWWSGGG